MTGIYKIDIVETELELKQLLIKEKIVSKKEKIQVLYLLKTGKAKTVTQAAEMIGRNRVTVQDWLAKYRLGGREKLLNKTPIKGRPKKIPAWAVTALEKRLQEEKGFDSYGEICQWLASKLGIVANYKTVHKLVYYYLQASPKIARTQSLSQKD
jgi:transposase